MDGLTQSSGGLPNVCGYSHLENTQPLAGEEAIALQVALLTMDVARLTKAISLLSSVITTRRRNNDAGR